MGGGEIGGSQSDVTVGDLSAAFLKGETGPSPCASAFNTSVAIWLADVVLEGEWLISTTSTLRILIF